MIFFVLFLLMVVVLVVATIMILIMYRTAKLDRVLYQELYFEDFPKSMEDSKIFFISDIHRRVISDRLLETVRNKADFVIIGGDLTEGSVPLNRVKQNIVNLNKIGPVYFVWGNNDYDVNPNELESLLLKHDVTILTNTAVAIKLNNDENVTLLGIDDISLKRDHLDAALAKCDDDKSFRILVSHNPLVKKQLRKKHGISLVLSGHTHGGQIRILGYGPYKLGGIEFVQNGLFVISNGYGTSTVPFRLGAKPETHVFTLKRGHHLAVGEKREIQL
jgi:predicted MPP superfamily phosphohydrolase